MKLQEKFSNQLLLKAIYHIDKQNEFGLLKVPEDIDYMFFDEVISKAIVNNHNIVDSLLFVMQNQQNYTIVFQEISNWCEDFILLEIPSKIDDSSVNLEEIIYEIPMTHHVVLSFLNHEHQDWGSLSETQIYELPYRVCSYLSTLSTNERIHFYSIFFKTLLQRVNIEEE